MCSLCVVVFLLTLLRIIYACAVVRCCIFVSIIANNLCVCSLCATIFLLTLLRLIYACAYIYIYIYIRIYIPSGTRTSSVART